MADQITATLSEHFTQEELEQIWQHEVDLLPGSKPDLVFQCDGNQVSMAFDPKHGGLKGIENIKTAFRIAIHRNHQQCKIAWND
jgi:hypothetical protein